jgi:putative ABC transport system permease protein
MNGRYELEKGVRFLLTRRLRSALSTLGVLFGVAAMVAMLSIGEGAKQESIEQIQQLGIHNIIIKQAPTFNDQEKKEAGNAIPQHIPPLNNEDAQRLQKGIPGLMHMAPIKAVPAKLLETSMQAVSEVLAVTRSFETLKNLELLEGRFICDQDVYQRRLVSVLGYDMAEQLGKTGPIGRTLRVNNAEYLIVGILKPTYWSAGKNHAISHRDINKAIFIPLGTENILSSTFPKESLTEIILQLDPLQNMRMIVEIVDQILTKSRYGQKNYQIIIPQELIKQASRTQETFNLVLGSIAAISLLVGGIGIMNIMLATVSERIREIGIRRAMGASKLHILRQFMIETILLTSIGAFFGIALGVITACIIAHFAVWKTIVSTWSLLLALLMAIGVGICSGLYPAIKAARMDPIAALRHH